MPALCSSESLVIRGVRLAVKHWHATAIKTPVIAVHGWLDNAASFDSLANFLPGHPIWAIDLAGHGRSDHRPSSSDYHLWQDVLDLALIIEQLSLDSCVVVGHSRGAAVAIMLACAQPQRVQQLVLLDGLMPLATSASKAPDQLAAFIGGMQRYVQEKKYSKRYITKTQAYAAREKRGLPLALSAHLATRQLIADRQGIMWGYDTRAHVASALKMTREQADAFLSNVTCQADIFIANPGFGYYGELIKKAAQYPAFTWHTVQGHHHFHMEASHAKSIALCFS